MSNGSVPDIPSFNDPQYEDLILALLEGTCIFLGAGVSKLAGYKLWDELKNAIVDCFWRNNSKQPFNKKIDYSLLENLKTHDKNLEVFDFLYSLNKDLFNSCIKDIFYKDEKNITNYIYNVLNKLKFGKCFFVTTNIDKSFQNYLGITDIETSIYPNLNMPSSKLITYLHGRIDFEESWIFTTSQYNSGYVKDNAPCKQFLVNLFEEYNVLFIGYGLKEDFLLRVISLTERRKKHYWLEGTYRNNMDYLKIRSTTLRENYNINLIPYSIDKDGHKSLIIVLNSLYKVIINYY